MRARQRFSYRLELSQPAGDTWQQLNVSLTAVTKPDGLGVGQPFRFLLTGVNQ
jgi:hypothetical protein